MAQTHALASVATEWPSAGSNGTITDTNGAMMNQTATPTSQDPAAASNGTPATRLPAPSDLPEADILIYDGHCRFCTTQVRRLRRFSGGRLAFLSLHDPETAVQFPDLTHDMLMEQMYLVDRRGRRHGGAAAFRYLTRHLPWLWPLAPLMHLPFSLPLWQALYRMVARQRYRWGKNECDEDGSCSVHF